MRGLAIYRVADTGMTPTPITEIGGTAADELVGVAVAAGLPVSVAISVWVRVAVASWLDASEGEMVVDESKPLPTLRTRAPRALLLVDESGDRSGENLVGSPDVNVGSEGLLIGGEPDPDWSVETFWDDAVVDGERQGECQSTDEHLARSGRLVCRVESGRAEFELCSCCNDTLVGDSEWDITIWETDFLCWVASRDKGTSN